MSSTFSPRGALQAEYRIPRERMVERLRDQYFIHDANVLEAMRQVPRHFFVPEALRGRAYGDHALPIDANQTISQPFIVARMTELLQLDKKSRVLEIGSGSGYQTAVLAQLAAQVYAIERIGERAKRKLAFATSGFTMRRSKLLTAHSVGALAVRMMEFW